MAEHNRYEAHTCSLLIDPIVEIVEMYNCLPPGVKKARTTQLLRVQQALVGVDPEEKNCTKPADVSYSETL